MYYSTGLTTATSDTLLELVTEDIQARGTPSRIPPILDLHRG